MSTALEEVVTTDTILVNAFNSPIISGRFEEQLQKSTLYSPALDSCLSEQDGTAQYTNHRLVEVIGSYNWIDSLNVCILTEIHVNEAFAPILALRNSAAISAVIVIGISIGLGIRVAQSIVKPIKTLVTTTQRIGRGDLDHQVNIQTNDEIGDLSRSFDQMITNLRQITASRDDLDAEIKVRQEVESQLRRREQTLQVALAAAKAGVWQWDIVDNKLTWDSTIETMHWMDMGTFDGEYDTWRALVDPDHVEAIEQVLQHALDGTQPYETEIPIINSDGQKRTILSQGTVLREDTDSSVRMIGVAIDITKRKQTENALLEREQTLSVALSAAQAGIWQWDIQSNQMSWDEASEVMFGLASGTFDGTYENWKRRVHPDDITEAESRIQNSLTQKTDLDLQFRIVQPSGAIRHISAQALITLDDNNMPAEAIGIYIDITDILAAQEALRQYQELLKIDCQFTEHACATHRYRRKNIHL